MTKEEVSVRTVVASSVMAIISALLMNIVPLPILAFFSGAIAMFFGCKGWENITD